MESVIDKSLRKDIFTNEYEYFFSFLTGRFDYATKLWGEELEKRFNKKFKPIWILSTKDIWSNKKENYIIINNKLKELKEKLNFKEVIYLQDYEDLNKEFCSSRVIKKIAKKLIKKQGRVFLLPFTSSFLTLNNKKIKILGPSPNIATRYDNKKEQASLFEKLNLPRNRTKVYKTIAEIKKKEEYPFYISSLYSSGGHESKTIKTEKDLEIFYSNLRAINKSSEFLVTKLITNIAFSPNVNAIVIGPENTKIICITDQILRENQYLGNIYPSKANKNQENKIIMTTKKVGNHLAKLGFRGLFGLDFIVTTNGNIFTVDLNPRRQGGYLCNILMSKKINIPEIELNLATGKDIQEFNYRDFHVNYFWAHSKVKTHYNPLGTHEVVGTLDVGHPNNPFQETGKSFKCIFYPKNSLFCGGAVGYCILTGSSYEKVLSKIKKETNLILKENIKPYDLTYLLRKKEKKVRNFLICSLGLSSDILK